MKKFITLLICLLCLTATSQNKESKTSKKDKEKKENKKEASSLTQEDIEKLRAMAKERKKHWPYVAKFIKTEYADKALKEIPKLEKAVTFYESKVRNATTKKSKDSYTEKLNKAKVDLEVAKLWPLYEKAYTITRKAYDEKDTDKYKKGNKLIANIQKRYKELKAAEFPNPKRAFYDKYGAKINQAIEKNLSKK